MLGSRSPLVGALSFLANALLAGCGDTEPGKQPPVTIEPGPASGSVCPPDSTLTYANFGMPFFESYCTRCHGENPPDGNRHGAPRGLNWDNLETIRAYAELIDAMAAAGPDAINSAMPPGMTAEFPYPTNDERRQLGEWLVCGAPE